MTTSPNYTVRTTHVGLIVRLPLEPITIGGPLLSPHQIKQNIETLVWLTLFLRGITDSQQMLKWETYFDFLTYPHDRQPLALSSHSVSMYANPCHEWLRGNSKELLYLSEGNQPETGEFPSQKDRMTYIPHRKVQISILFFSHCGLVMTYIARRSVFQVELSGMKLMC